MVNRGGFALIEVIVALTLLSVGLLGIAGSAALAGRLMREAEADEQASTEAAQVLDSLTQQRAPTSGFRQAGRVRLTWTVNTDSTGTSTIDLVVTYPNGSALRSATFRALSNVP